MFLNKNKSTYLGRVVDLFYNRRDIYFFFPLICITEEFFFFDPLQQESSKKRYWCFQFMWAVWLVGVRSHNLLVGLFVVVLKLCSIFVVFWSRCFSRVSRGFWFVAAG